MSTQAVKLPRKVVGRMTVEGVALCIHAMPYGLFRRIASTATEDTVAMMEMMLAAVEACVRTEAGEPIDAADLDADTLAELAKAAMPGQAAKAGAEADADFPKPPEPCATGGSDSAGG